MLGGYTGIFYFVDVSYEHKTLTLSGITLQIQGLPGDVQKQTHLLGTLKQKNHMHKMHVGRKTDMGTKCLFMTECTGQTHRQEQRDGKTHTYRHIHTHACMHACIHALTQAYTHEE